jgi:hypothetical protein
MSFDYNVDRELMKKAYNVIVAMDWGATSEGFAYWGLVADAINGLHHGGKRFTGFPILPRFGHRGTKAARVDSPDEVEIIAEAASQIYTRFKWWASPQGHEFWRTVCSALRGLAGLSDD